MLDLFATQVTGSSTGTKSALTGATLTGGKNDAQTIDFWNFILGQIADEEFRTDSNKKETTEDVITEKIQGEKADLALLQLALLGQDVDEDLNQKLADLQIERIALKKENRIEQLTKLVNHLTSGLPKPPEGGTVEELVQRLNNRIEKLEASLDSFRSGDFGEDGSPFKLLIATGLNPAQLTEITNRIEEVETKLGRELTAEDLIAGVGNIVPAPGDDDHEFSAPDALSILAKTVKTPEESTKEIKNEKTTIENIKEKEENVETDSLITEVAPVEIVKTNVSIGLPNEQVKEITSPVVAVKNFVRKQNAPTPVSFDRPASTPTTPLNPSNNSEFNPVNDDGSILPSEELDTRLSNAEFKELFGSKKNNSNSNFALTNKATNNNALVNAMKAVENNLSSNMPAIFIDEASLTSQSILSEALGFDIQTGTPFNQTVQAAHLVSSTTVAGQSHATTKMVSAHVAKAAQSGETKAITLHLDPPELGRVEVRLEFGKEKSVKAHLIVEKPETLLMLQRDASALEKALQDSGLETSSDSLNYEMATEDHAFHSGKDGQNPQDGKTGTDLESDLEDEILTTMDWDVDPETGHVHYSILA